MGKKARIKRERREGKRKDNKSDRKVAQRQQYRSDVMSIKADEPSLIVRPTLNDIVASNMTKR